MYIPALAARPGRASRPVRLASLLPVIMIALAVVSSGLTSPAAAAAATGLSTVSGVANDFDGGPAANALVTAFSGGGGAQTRTEANGHFSVPVANSDTVSLRLVSGDNRWRLDTAQFPITGDRDLGTITLPPTIELKVRVLDSAGTPVEGARVMQSDPSPQGAWADSGYELSPGISVNYASLSNLEQVTDQDGYAPALTLLRGEQPPFQVDYTVPGTTFTTSQTIPGTTLTTDTDQTINLEVPAVSTVSGVANDFDGGPAANALVTAFSGSGGAQTRTEANGHFSVPVANSDTVSLRLVSGDNRWRLDTAQFPITGDRDLGTITLPPTIELKVRVLDSAGTPVEGARVMQSDPSPQGAWADSGYELSPGISVNYASLSNLEQVTDQDGYAPALTLLRGEQPPFQVDYTVPGTTFTTSQTIPGTTLTTDTDQTINLEVPAVSTVSGVANDFDGGPAANALVTAFSGSGGAQTRTEANGHFSVPVANSDTVSLRLVSGDNRWRLDTAQFPITGDRDLGTITLPPTIELKVRVLDSAGTPVEGARVMQSDPSPQGAWADSGYELSPGISVNYASLSNLEQVTDQDGYAPALTLLRGEQPPFQVDYTVPGTTFTTSQTIPGTTLTTDTDQTINLSIVVPRRPTAPTTPTVTGSTPPGGAVSVAFSPPASDGGSPITSYTALCVSTDGGANATRTGAASPLRVTGLTSGKQYHCRVRATNAVGTGPASTPSNPVTPAAKPGTPTGVTATRGNTTATVTWTPPAANGSPISGYAITSSPGGVTKTVAGTLTSAKIGGLTNGTSYTFTVKATNAIGTSPASTPSNPVTPAAKPGTPTGVTATRGNTTATVTWTPPAANGSPISGYAITSSPGGVTKTVAATLTSAKIGGLTNGTSYTFTVKATNAIGTSPASTPSNPVTPAAKPGTPTGVTATRGNTTATVTWTPPAANGSPISGYTITSSPGGVTKTVAGTLTSAKIGGLTNGTSYTFTVKATNAIGTSPASTPSNPVTPAAKPGTPTGVTATRGNTTATVTWTPPAANGSPISGYTITSSPGGVTKTVAGTLTSAKIGGLTNGTSYTFTVKATNAIGTSPASTPSNPVTP